MNDTQKSALLKAAYEFFDTTPSEATREIVKKAYKRKSLLHHPDRNGDSEESNNMMQKVNNYYEVLEKEFDRIENGGTEEESMDGPDLYEEPDSREEEEGDEEELADILKKYPTEQDLPSGKKGKKIRRQWNEARKNRSCKQRCWRDEERVRMEREMRKEWEEIKKHQKEMKKQIKKQTTKLKKEGLHTVGGRSRANGKWVLEIQKKLKIW